MNQKMVVTITVAALVLCGGTIAAADRSVEDSNMIQAAYNKATGALRIVTNGEIKGNEVPVSWNQQGIQGNQGEQGETGPAGSAGEAGYGPFAFAYIQADGLKLSGTSNLSVEKEGDGRYRITMEGEPYQKGAFLTFVNASNSMSIPSIENEEGQGSFDVYFYNVIEEPVDTDFQIMIYKTDLTEQLTTYYRDQDGDGYGISSDHRTAFSPEGYYTATRGGDFDDNHETCYPGAPEIADAMDNDGDGEVDEGLSGTKYYWDEDQDGYGYTKYGRFGDENSEFILAKNPMDSYTATIAGDWDDSDPEINPGAPEITDGVDNDCDGEIDEEE